MINKMWYAIASSKEIKGSVPYSLKRLNLNLVLYRDSKGVVHCLEERCSHRGASLALGKVKCDRLQCPFHGIEFNSEGKCELVPALGKGTLDDLSRFNIKSYLVKEYMDIIYLYYGDDCSMDESLPFFNEEINEEYDYFEMTDHWNTHYSRAIENQLDVIHLPFIHHNTIGRGNKTLVNGPKVIFSDENILTSANNEKDFGQKPKKRDDCEIKDTYLKFKFPNVWCNHINDKIKVLIFFAPVDEENTILYLRFYNKITKFKPINHIISYFGTLANGIIERQDKRVVITQEPKASSLKSKEKLIQGDYPIVVYRTLREKLKNKV